MWGRSGVLTPPERLHVHISSVCASRQKEGSRSLNWLVYLLTALIFC